MSEHLHLIDSSVWIRVFRRPPALHLALRVQEIVDQTAAVNGIIKVEILGGARNEAEFQEILETVGALINLAINDVTWDSASRLGYELRRKGVSVSIPDLIIAASAIEHKAVLVHADADFNRIAANSDLKVESYAEAAL